MVGRDCEKLARLGLPIPTKQHEERGHLRLWPEADSDPIVTEVSEL
jgi:hypothetical protein